MKTKFTLLVLSILITSSFYSQSWTTLGLGLNDKGRVLLNDTVNNKLIVGGDFTYVGTQSAPFIAVWDGTNWQNIGAGFNAPVYALAIYNNELYAGGNFTLSGTDTVKYIAKWNGVKWISVGQKVANNNVKFLKTYQGKLYISGDFTSYGNIVKRNITWNGTAFDSIAGFPNGPIYDIAFYKFKTYFACNGTLISSNGFTYQYIIGSGAGTGSIYIKSLEVHQNMLYVSGYNTSSNSQYCADVYDGANYQGYYMFNALYPTDGPINIMKSFGNDLFMGGNFYYASYGTSSSSVSVYNITRFASGTQTFYSMNYGTDGQVRDMEVFKNRLYIVGDFVSAGSTTSNYISRWGSPTGINENENDNIITIYPNPFSSSTTIKLSSEMQNSNLTVYNIFGQVVKTIAVSGNSIHIERENLVSGIYFIQLTKDNKTIATEKIIITD